MHGTIVGHGTEDHGGRRYKISDKDQMHNHQDKKKHAGQPILAEEYLRNEMLETNRTWTDGKINKYIDHSLQLYNYKSLNKMETEGKDTVPRTIQPTKHTNAEHTKAKGKSGNSTKDKWECDKCIIKKITLWWDWDGSAGNQRLHYS